jgi:hypothetical protein
MHYFVRVGIRAPGAARVWGRVFGWSRSAQVSINRSVTPMITNFWTLSTQSFAVAIPKPYPK